MSLYHFLSYYFEFMYLQHKLANIPLVCALLSPRDWMDVGGRCYCRIVYFFTILLSFIILNTVVLLSLDVLFIFCPVQCFTYQNGTPF